MNKVYAQYEGSISQGQVLGTNIQSDNSGFSTLWLIPLVAIFIIILLFTYFKSRNRNK